jgi:hypothetical protein
LNPEVEPHYSRNLFASALAGSLLLMASGLFLGTIGIDDEFNALTTVFDATGRGLWAQHIITFLLPGQLGISFAPMVLGCALYALSIAILIRLWGPIRARNGYISAAIIGSFPYFASMMTFDVAQVAYPLGFVLISASLIPIFNSRSKRSLAISILAFALAFACYQGVATTVATAWASVAGMRFFTSDNRNAFIEKALPVITARTAITVIAGALAYLVSVKASQAIIPHTPWGDTYGVQTSFALTDPTRLKLILDNAISLMTGKSGEFPITASALLLTGIATVATRLVWTPDVRWWYRVALAPAFLISVLVLPFWLLFVQSMPLTPRSTVGLGILFGYVFAALTINSHRRVTAFLTGISALIIINFAFTGNAMFYTQFLANQAEQVTVSRVASRLDAVAKENRLQSPFEVTFIGRYAPAGRQFAKYDTIGSSPLDWDQGNIHRQAALFSLYGVDGITINRNETLRQEIYEYIQTKQVPSWPDPNSVFYYKNSIVVVNFGRL